MTRTLSLALSLHFGQRVEFFQAEWGTLWGTKVVGMRLGRSIDWGAVEALVGESHRLLAPKKVALKELSSEARGGGDSVRAARGTRVARRVRTPR